VVIQRAKFIELCGYILRRLSAILLLLAGASTHAAECLTYSNQVTLQGVLSQHTFPEQPNYESIENGDAAATYFFVSPYRPICVAEGKNNDGLEPAESAVAEIQLAFRPAKQSYRQLRAYLGKEVVCFGSIYHAHTGHHHSSVLLFNAKCRPTQRSTRSARKVAQTGKFQHS